MPKAGKALVGTIASWVLVKATEGPTRKCKSRPVLGGEGAGGAVGQKRLAESAWQKKKKVGGIRFIGEKKDCKTSSQVKPP